MFVVANTDRTLPCDRRERTPQVTIVRSEKRRVPLSCASYQHDNFRLEKMKKPRTWKIRQLGCAHVTVTHEFMQFEDPKGSAKLTTAQFKEILSTQQWQLRHNLRANLDRSVSYFVLPSYALLSSHFRSSYLMVSS